MAQTSLCSLSLCVSLVLPIHMHTGVHMHIIHSLSALYQPNSRNVDTQWSMTISEQDKQN